MSKNTSNIYFGPATQVQISGSSTTDLGYMDSINITFEPTPININDGQNYQGVGLAKVEAMGKESTAVMVLAAEALKDLEGYIIVTSIDGQTYTCGPALANVKTERSFEAGEGHILTVSLQKYVANESDFIVIS